MQILNIVANTNTSSVFGMMRIRVRPEVLYVVGESVLSEVLTHYETRRGVCSRARVDGLDSRKGTSLILLDLSVGSMSATKAKPTTHASELGRVVFSS